MEYCIDCDTFDILVPLLYYFFLTPYDKELDISLLNRKKEETDLEIKGIFKIFKFLFKINFSFFLGLGLTYLC